MDILYMDFKMGLSCNLVNTSETKRYLLHFSKLTSGIRLDLSSGYTGPKFSGPSSLFSRGFSNTHLSLYSLIELGSTSFHWNKKFNLQCQPKSEIPECWSISEIVRRYLCHLIEAIHSNFPLKTCAAIVNKVILFKLFQLGRKHNEKAIARE